MHIVSGIVSNEIERKWRDVNFEIIVWLFFYGFAIIIYKNKILVKGVNYYKLEIRFAQDYSPNFTTLKPAERGAQRGQIVLRIDNLDVTLCKEFRWSFRIRGFHSLHRNLFILFVPQLKNKDNRPGEESMFKT